MGGYGTSRRNTLQYSRIPLGGIWGSGNVCSRERVSWNCGRSKGIYCGDGLGPSLAHITFFKRGPADPSQQCKTASNSIQDPPPRWILTIFKLKFGGGNLFSPAMTSTIEGNKFVGSLLKPLLKKVTPIVGSRMLCKWKEVYVVINVLPTRRPTLGRIDRTPPRSYQAGECKQKSTPIFVLVD
jgi:hypothetical protein